MVRIVFLCLTIACVSAAERLQAQEAAGAGLQEGWEKSFPIPIPELGEGDRYVVWVKGGWLQARRQTEGGVVDWHIVLARATDPKPPTITATKGKPRFEVSYQNGRYFIREDIEVLACVRERKTGDRKWHGLTFAADGYKPAGSVGGSGEPPMLEGWKNRDGFFVTSTPGPSRGGIDCLVRLSPLDADTESGKKGGHGFGMAHGSPLRRVFYNDAFVQDDGELLYSMRLLEAATKHNLETGDPAPPLSARTLDGKPMDLKDYRGKYVLLDFWATWCAPCIAEFPHLTKVYEQFGKDDRLVMISLSLDDEIDSPKKFLSDKNMPWVQAFLGDSADSVSQAYGIRSIPATFLIGPDGRIISKGMRGEELRKAVARPLAKP